MAVVAFTTRNLCAQEPWAETSRPSITGAAAVATQLPSASPEAYNFQIGPARFKWGASLISEFNDNVNLSEIAPKSDLIFTPHLGLSGVWVVTGANELRLNLGLGYREYLNGSRSGECSAILDPGSSLSFDVYVGNNLRLNLHDSFSTSADPTEQANLSNVAHYSRFENTLGISLLWDLNAFVVTASYDHFDYKSLTRDYSTLNRHSELFSTSVYYYLTEATKVGITASPSFNYFTENYQNDSVLLSVGPFLEMNPLQYLKVRASAGCQEGDFTSGGGNQDTSKLSTAYYNVAFAHRMNAFMTESLHFGHEAQLGLSTNYEEIDFVRYTLQLGIVRDFPIFLNAFYERINDSPGVVAEKIDRFGAGCRVGWQATAHWNLSLEYQFLSKGSNQELLSYKQNRVIFTAGYQF